MLSKITGSQLEPSDSKPSLRPGARVRGVVSRILRDRLLLRLPHGAHGFIRQRDLSWDPELRSPENFAKVNDILEAVVVDIDPATRSVELSLRFVERDPWQDLAQRLPLDTALDASVLQVRDFGTFVEIEAGVEGFIPDEQSPADPASSLSEPLWPEDLVRVVVSEIDLQRRRITLRRQRSTAHGGEAAVSSSRDRLASVRLGDFLDQKTRRRLLQTVGDLPTAINWPPPDRILNILVADDNIDFKSTLAELLREVGYTVHEASVAAEALQQLEDHPCDLAILDISLSTDDPLELARRALSLNPDLRVLLLSGFEVETTVSREAEELGFRLESKPLGPRALAEVLRAFERGETVVHQDSSGSSIPSKTQTASPSTTDLRDLVEKTRRDAGADYAVLFENDPQRPSRVLWPYCAGIELADSEDLHATLLYSPVGEVLRDRRIVRIVDTRQVPRRVTYLMRAVAFSSCLGMPIEIPSRPQPYAFFLFSRRPHTFLESGLNDVTAACRQIGQRLFRQHEFDRFVGLQEELLQSRLRAGALHDIRNTLGSMAFKLNSLEHLVGKPAKEPKATLEAAHTDVLSIQTFAEQMEKTTSLLRELTEDTLLMPVDVNALVHRLVERQRLLASHLSVGLSFEPDQRVPASVLRSAQLQQVADNVILNALQWCQGRRAKQTEISTHYDPEDATLPIKIRISDTGPGIHRRLQADTIFELGFSRRQGGSGLGLFVSRALMDAMGGTVVVENSIMDVGTNFLISIPHNSGRL